MNKEEIVWQSTITKEMVDEIKLDQSQTNALVDALNDVVQSVFESFITNEEGNR